MPLLPSEGEQHDDREGSALRVITELLFSFPVSVLSKVEARLRWSKMRLLAAAGTTSNVKVKA